MSVIYNPKSFQSASPTSTSLKPRRRRPNASLDSNSNLLFCFVESGLGTFLVNYTSFGFNAPSLFCLPADQFHVFVKADLNDSLKMHKVWIDQNKLPKNLGRKIRLQQILHFHQLSTKVRRQLEANIYSSHKSKNSWVDSTIIQQLARQDAKVMEAHPFPNIPPSDIQNLKKIIEFTVHHYRQPFSIYDLAMIMDKSPLSVCQYFKEHCRMTYARFLKILRLQQAKCLMWKYPHKSCRSIALEVGFDNTAQLSRAFKSELKLSVSQYRVLIKERLSPLPN
ncbi:MAG: helix-turn-helix domain-containing protein [Flavobacteriaceae bacterium]